MGISGRLSDSLGSSKKKGLERALSEHSEVAVAGKVNEKSQANVKLNLLPLTIDTVDDFEKKYPKLIIQMRLLPYLS